MGLEKVKREILDNAQNEASGITDAAQADARAIIKSAEKQASELEERAREGAEKASELLKKRELAAAELELQKQALAAKNELVERVFSQAVKEISKLSGKKMEAHIRSLLSAARKGMEVSVLYCNGRDAGIAEAAGDGKLKVLRDDTIAGGIIAESRDGRLRMDFSYDALLEQAKSKVLGDVARKLFGK